ncbi:hypothetical protein [Rappaport israeli]|uniref:hypothetical protein n=1 Tax=Rappaport israeli TaxID=1839807 RepID=UPI001178859D|nr:hypothetical protein [Rappaport israeli]
MAGFDCASCDYSDGVVAVFRADFGWVLGGVGTVGVLSGMGGVSLWLALVLGLAVMLVVMVPAFVSGGNAVVVGRLPSGYGDGFGGRMNGRRGGGGYRGGGGGFGGGGAGGSW